MLVSISNACKHFKRMEDAEVALHGAGNSPLKPGLGRGLHFVKPCTSCSTTAQCSAPTSYVSGSEETQKDSKMEHYGLCLGQQHSVYNPLPLSPSLSMAAIITLFLTVLLPREFAQLMYISGSYEDILDSHEFLAVNLDGDY